MNCPLTSYGGACRSSCSDKGEPAVRISIFPLPGAILFPGMQLPLHIFEPRYRAMVQDALARGAADRLGLPLG